MEKEKNNSPSPEELCISLMDSICPVGRQKGCPASHVVDKALLLLLSREESVLGSIVDQCREIVKIAENEAHAVAEYLEHEM